MAWANNQRGSHVNICLEHWEQLRAAIAKRGLDQYIAKDGAAALKVFTGQLEDNMLRLETFDPLLSANNMIFSVAMKYAGLDLLASDEKTGKPRCPLCYVAGPKAPSWIEGAADEMAKMVERLKKGPVTLNTDGTSQDSV